MAKRVEMKYEDGVELLTPTEYKINSYIKQLLPTGFKWYKRYSITNYYKSGDFTVSSINMSIEQILHDVTFDLTIPMKEKHLLLNSMFFNVMKIINEIYNEVACESSDNIYSFSIDNMMEIQFHKDIITALNRVKDEETEEAIQNVYNTIDKTLRTKEFDNNLLAVTYRAGGVKKQQFMQCFGVRGFAANIYSKIYRKPVISNYNLGYQSTYDMAADSVSAAVAMYYSTTAIQDSETFSKKIRTLATRVKNLIYEDCGSDEYLKVSIRTDGDLYGEFLPSDLMDYKGKFYKESLDDKELKVITGKEEHLKGKSIYIRMGFNCKCEPGDVCVYCLGLTGLNSLPTDIIGVWLLSALTDVLNQIVLSTKHHIASATNDKIVFKEPIAKKYLTVGKESDIKLKKGTSTRGGYGYGNKGELIVKSQEFFGLKDIDVKNINSIVPAKISRISKIWIDRNDGGVPVELEVKQAHRYGYLTAPLIKYIVLKNKYKITEDGEFVRISLDEWKASTPIIKIPEATFDYRVFGASVRKLIQSSDNLVEMTKEELFVELHELISRKININVSILDILVKVMMCKDPDNGDYRLPRYGEPYKLSGPEKINDRSSIATAMAMGNMGDRFFSYNPYEPDNKMDSIYDTIFMPEILDRY